jgi:hypothetical protein
MITVHIGLGKCASTSLQTSVFPELERIKKNIQYNSRKLVYLAHRHHLVPLNISEKRKFNKVLQNGKSHFISHEALVNWDPVYFEKAADLNLELFGRKANIIIIIRDPLSYFTSIYQQMIHQGNIIPADDFFVTKDIYDIIKPSMVSELRYLNTDVFSLQKLNEIYTERFDKVFFIPLSKVKDLSFLKDTCDISTQELEHLKNKFRDAPRVNVAYSSLAMELTFKREKILNFLGLKSYGSYDRLLDLHVDATNLDSNPAASSPWSGLCFTDKLKQSPIRVMGRIRWRSLMQNVVNKYMPYRKYMLPEGLAISQKNLEENAAYLKKIEEMS